MKPVMQVLLFLLFGVFVYAQFFSWLFGGLPNRGQQATQEPVRAPEPLTTPLTLENSYLHDFGHGKIVRVPKALLPGADFRTLPQPFVSQKISMVFWFPEMVPTGWVGQRDTIFEEMQGKYVLQKNRFRVNILHMFYSPGELGIPSASKDLPRMPRWRPIAARRKRDKDAPRSEFSYSDVGPSEYRGLQQLLPYVADRDEQNRLDDIRRRQGWDGVSRQVIYIEVANSPYELDMHCNTSAGVLCSADVYSKSSGFQYRVLFPSEAIANTDQLVRTINQMIDDWLIQPTIKQTRT